MHVNSRSDKSPRTNRDSRTNFPSQSVSPNERALQGDERQRSSSPNRKLIHQENRASRAWMDRFVRRFLCSYFVTQSDRSGLVLNVSDLVQSQVFMTPISIQCQNRGPYARRGKLQLVPFVSLVGAENHLNRMTKIHSAHNATTSRINCATFTTKSRTATTLLVQCHFFKLP